MTFFFGLLDPATQTLRFSSAGHLDPYVYRAATQRLEALSSWGFPLGVRRREPFTRAQRRLRGRRPPHSLQRRPDRSDRRRRRSVRLRAIREDDPRAAATCSAEDIKKTLLTSIRKFTRNRPPEDDQTLVVVSFEGGDARAAIAGSADRRLRACGLRRDGSGSSSHAGEALQAILLIRNSCIARSNDNARAGRQEARARHSRARSAALRRQHWSRESQGKVVRSLVRRRTWLDGAESRTLLSDVSGKPGIPDETAKASPARDPKTSRDATCEVRRLTTPGGEAARQRNAGVRRLDGASAASRAVGFA